jgi:hypothetical protein
MKRVEKIYKKQTTSEEQLKERLKFETLLADISSRFVNVPAQEVDSEIIDACCRVLTKNVTHGSPEHKQQCAPIAGRVTEETAKIIIREKGKSILKR